MLTETISIEVETASMVLPASFHEARYHLRLMGHRCDRLDGFASAGSIEVVDKRGHKAEVVARQKYPNDATKGP